MRWLLTYSLILFCLLCASAQEDVPFVRDIRSIADTNPDSALQLIDRWRQQYVNGSDRSLEKQILLTHGELLGELQRHDSAMVVLHQLLEIVRGDGDLAMLANVCSALGFEYNYSNEKDKALEYLREGLNAAKRVGDIALKRRILARAGLIHGYNLQNDSAEYYMMKVLEGNYEKDFPIEAAKIYGNLGNNAGRTGEVARALEYYETGIEIVRESGDFALLVTFYLNAGYTCQTAGDFPGALTYYLKAYESAEIADAPEEIANSLAVLGEFYKTQGDIDTALYFFDKSYQTWESIGDSRQITNQMYRISEIHMLRGEYDLALGGYLRSLAIHRSEGRQLYSDLLRSLGNSYRKLNQIDSAEYYYDVSLEQAVRARDLREQSLTTAKLAELYLETGRIDEAIEIISEGLNQTRLSQFREGEMELNKLLADAYRSNGDFEQALRYREIAWSMRDSLFNEANVKEIGRLEARNAMEQVRREELIEREREKARERLLRFAMLGLLLVSAIIIILIVRNVRQKQKSNARLQAQNDLIEQQNHELSKLDELKTQFFTDISHELRTPLTVISAMNEQMLENPDKWLEQGSEMIRKNTSDLLSLVSNILELRKLENNAQSVEMVKGDIVQYLRYISQSFESFAISKEINFHIESSVDSFTMDFDAEKLVRVVSNLVSNAMKFTPPDGHVYLKMRLIQAKTGELFEIRVEDTGKGIPAGDLKHVFDRFYQSSSTSGGTGIGLALSKGLVELMNGTISVASEEDVGSVFAVRLPVTRSAEMLVSNIAEAGDVPSSPFLISTGVDSRSEAAEDKPAILIVEDNPDVMAVIKASVEGHYQLDESPDGVQGVETALQTIPDLIISDVMMPGKTGYELCDELKKDERTSHIPIILLTAKADQASKLDGIGYGADAYMSKPFDRKELTLRIDKLLELRRSLQAKYAGAASRTSDAPPDREHEFLGKIRNLVLAHIDESEFGIPEIAREVGMSRSQLYRKTKSLTAKSPSVFVRSIRLHKAAELLRETDLNVSEVCYDVGFTSPVYFSRAFLEEFGVQPSAARK